MSSTQDDDSGRSPADEEPAKPLPQLLDPRWLKTEALHGVRLPYHADTEAGIQRRLEQIKTFKFKDGDFLLCAYPKSGSHWLMRMLDMMVSGSTLYRAQHSFDQTFLDLQDLDLISNLDPGRVLFTHYPFDLLPDEVKDGRTKIVHLYRNPKAVIVSMHFMWRAAGLIDEDFTVGSLIERFLNKNAVYGSCFYHTDTVLEFKKRHPAVPVFHLSYEDLTQDTAGWLRKLADYLGLHVSRELCNDIATAVTFSTQKQQEESMSGQDTFTHRYKIYRTGEADDWKNHLTVSQSERLDHVIRQQAASCPMYARYVSEES